jgi:hypothetical protein
VAISTRDSQFFGRTSKRFFAECSSNSETRAVTVISKLPDTPSVELRSS